VVDGLFRESDIEDDGGTDKALDILEILEDRGLEPDDVLDVLELEELEELEEEFVKELEEVGFVDDLEEDDL